MSDAEQEELLRLKFTWGLPIMRGKTISFKINFTDPESLSQTSYGSDKLLIRINKTPLLRHYRSGKTLQEDTQLTYLDLRPILQNKAAKTAIKGAQSSINPIKILTTQTLVVNVVLSKGLQDLWGMLNTQ